MNVLFGTGPVSVVDIHVSYFSIFQICYDTFDLFLVVWCAERKNSIEVWVCQEYESCQFQVAD